jgi:hypothetical protein
MVIGEAAARLPQAFREAHPQVEWRDIVAFRNIAVHAYFAVQWDYEQNLQSSRQNSQSSKQIDRSFLSLGNKPFRLKLSRCCLRTRRPPCGLVAMVEGRGNVYGESLPI